MRKKLLILTLLALFAGGIVSCVSENEPLKPQETEEKILQAAPTERNLAVRDFALAINEAITKNQSFRKLVFEEGNKDAQHRYNVGFEFDDKK